MLAGLFVVAGIVGVVRPREMVMLRAAAQPGGGAALGRQESYFESVSRKKCRVYGSIAIAMGSGLAFLALYRGK